MISMNAPLSAESVPITRRIGTSLPVTRSNRYASGARWPANSPGGRASTAISEIVM